MEEDEDEDEEEEDTAYRFWYVPFSHRPRPKPARLTWLRWANKARKWPSCHAFIVFPRIPQNPPQRQRARRPSVIAAHSANPPQSYRVSKRPHWTKPMCPCVVPHHPPRFWGSPSHGQCMSHPAMRPRCVGAQCDLQDHRLTGSTLIVRLFMGYVASYLARRQHATAHQRLGTATDWRPASACRARLDALTHDSCTPSAC